MTVLMICHDFLMLHLCSFNRSWCFLSALRNKWFHLLRYAFYFSHFLLWSIPLYLLIYNLCFVFIDSFKAGVSQGLLLKCHLLIFRMGKHLLYFSDIILWNDEYATLASLIVNISRQSITDIATLNLTILAWHMLRPQEGSESHKELLLTLPVIWNTAKWSDILVHNIHCTCFESVSKLLVNIWSISVAVSLVTLVGLVISGNILYEYMISKKSDVGLWFPCLRRSIFRSPRK